MEQIELKVAGMTCGACATRVSRALLSVPGVHGAEVDVARGLARVRADDAGAAQPALLQVLAATGYPAVAVTSAAVEEGHAQEAAAAGRGCCCGH